MTERQRIAHSFDFGKESDVMQIAALTPRWAEAHSAELPSRKEEESKSSISSWIEQRARRAWNTVSDVFRWETKANTADLRAHVEESLIPQTVKQTIQARTKIMELPIEKDDDHIAALLQDPRWKSHVISFLKTMNDETPIQAKLDGYTVLLKPKPKTNGYNTEYIITAEKDGKIEEWQQLAIRFTARTPEYRTLSIRFKHLSQRKEACEKAIQQLEQELASLSPSQKSSSKKENKSPRLSPKKREAEIKRIKKVLLNKREQDQELQEALTAVSGKISKVEKKYEDFSYTPYAEAFNTPEIRKYGFQYLRQSVKRAWGNTVFDGYRTPLEGGKLSFRDAFPPEVALTLAIVERMDFVKYLAAWDPKTRRWALRPQAEVNALMDSQIQKALTTVGLNRETTFNFQRSDAGALGIAQMMPGSHALMTRAYPGLLPANPNQKGYFSPDFEKAGSDEQQSLRFMYVHLIDQASQLAANPAIRQDWRTIMHSSKTKLGMYGLLAAGYNGSMARVRDEAFGKGFKNLSLKQIETKLDQGKLLDQVDSNMETYTYVMKFAYVWNYLRRQYPKEFDTDSSSR